jgi:hydrogenase small subunit
MIGLDDGLLVGLLERGVSRRTFLKFCAAMTTVLALPAAYAPRVAAAVSSAPRMPVIWLRGQGCGGDTEAFLRAANPSTAALLLDLLSVDYQDALMAPTGAAAEAARLTTISRYPNGYIAVIEGSIPAADGGACMTIGGRAFADVVGEVTAGALATIAIGSCAFDGGLAAAAGGTTGSAGVGSIVQKPGLVALPGCPVNVENLTATIVHYLTFKEMPATDLRGRPLFAYGGLIHNQCERRPHFEFGEFVQAWGDEGAQKGWCLYKMGCKGPQSFANCPTARYGEGVSWAVKAGAACIGCTMPGFWDAMSPFSRRLPSPVPFAPDLTADQIGLAAIAGVGGLAAAHGTASFARSRVRAVRHAGGTPEAPVQPVVAPEAGPIALDTAPVDAAPAAAPGAVEVVLPTNLEPADPGAPGTDDALVDAPASAPAEDELSPEPLALTNATQDAGSDDETSSTPRAEGEA